MKEIKRYEIFNKYSGSNWDSEHTTKYIFELRNGKIIEAGYFIHFYGDKEKKRVIELPTSYGCPMKCKFCASSFINDVQQLNADEVLDIYNYIYETQNLKHVYPLFVSMTGIGDLYFTIDLVEKITSSISNDRNDIGFTVSSCFWTESMIKRIENIYNNIKFRAIQITYISYDNRILQNLIGYYTLKYNDRPTFQQTVQHMFNSKIQQFRINYLMLKGINDTREDFFKFLSLILPVKDKVIIRISKLNTTKASIVNNISESSIERMGELKLLLDSNGFKAYLFYSVINDGMNCGQLLTERDPDKKNQN